MLKVQQVPGFLERSCTEGVTAAFFMTTSGALLGTGGSAAAVGAVSEHVQAAICANVWESFASMPTSYESGETRKQGGDAGSGDRAPQLTELLLELEGAIVAIQGFGEYVVCLSSGPDMDTAFLRSKLSALVDALAGAFKRLAAHVGRV